MGSWRAFVYLNRTSIIFIIGTHDRRTTRSSRASGDPPSSISIGGSPVWHWQSEVVPVDRDRIHEGMPKKVLVVDDHAATRNLIRSVLESEKYEEFEVVEAANGAECLKAFDERSPFDLVLLDVNLPDVDGYTVCSALRRADDDVPIVFVTAKGDLRDYASGREAGGDSYIVKPIARAALRSMASLFTSIGRRQKGAGKDEPADESS